MEQTENKNIEVNEDAELDISLDSDLAAIKAVQTGDIALPPKQEEPKPETPSAEATNVKPTSQAPNKADIPADDSQNVIAESFKTPVKGKFESDESFDKRVELANLVAQRKAAPTEEEKQRLSTDISSTRKELRALNGKSEDMIIKPLNNSGAQPEPAPNQTPEEIAKAADLERLRELGGVTKEDLQQIVQQERFQEDVKNTVNSFVEKHPELSDPDTREVYFAFVEANYNWQGKAGKDLSTVLELARENMFRPSESIQDRVLKGANVQEKVNAMQFPGGTIVGPGIPADKAQSVKELMETGMSEEKALELISD